MTGQLEGRRALITGGASGIGLACVDLFRREGARVVIMGRQTDDVVDVAAQHGVSAVIADVRDVQMVTLGVEQAAVELRGTPDILVNAAGVYRITPLLDVKAEEWLEVLAVNLTGSFVVAQQVARRLAEEGGGGAIVNISSIAGFLADEAEPAGHYGASKAGVIALTKQMAVEWAPHKIRVNAVCPGAIDTPMLRMMDNPKVGQAFLDSRVPLRRLGQPQEVAEVIAFLASAAASYVTGTTVLVDGGVTAT